MDDVSFLSECDIVDSPAPPSSKAQQPSSSSTIAVVPSCSSSCSLSTCSSGPLSTLTSKRGVVVTRGVQHRYPFLLKIAYELDLPASFRGTYGYIAYKLVAFVKTKKGCIVGALKDIIIYPILDLNHLDQTLQQPVNEKRIFKSLFGYNYVFMKCHMDKRAFLPEESISFTVEVTNKSPATLEGVEVNLNMSTKFSIYGASKVEDLTLLRIRGPCISQGEHAIWAHSFNFPGCSYPSGFGQLSRMRSKSIDLQYTIFFSLEVSKAESFLIPFPIVIGTVPYGHNSRVLCMNHHLNSSMDALSLGPSSGVGGDSGGGSSSASSVCSSGRRSGGNVTPSSSSMASSSRHHSRDSVSSSRRQTPDSSAGAVAAGQPSSASRGCSGGFCCAVRGHHPRCRRRSKSTSALPPSYSAANLYYQCIMLRRAETRKNLFLAN